MDIVKKLVPKYCSWLVAFCKEVVGVGNSQRLLFYGALGVIKDFANIVAFFIPLKVVMVLSNPDILSLDFFASSSIDIEKFIVYSGALFLLLMLVSFVCHVVLAVLIHHSARQLWKVNKTKFPSIVAYKNLYQQLVDTITHILIIIVGLAVVLLLDKYLSMPIVIVIVNCIAASIWLSRYTKREIRVSPLKKPKLVFKLFSDIGFSLTFICIIIEYYLNKDMNVLFTLLAVLISKIVFSNIQQLFLKQRILFVKHYIKKQ
ncbi:MAG: hypothetical protein A6F70_03165 [Cycloclasticus sp. symbiont of Bathymodiolus heckerae]|nr:MAG: hypothetical protein A6F70_03165 [Cycloclasticus sp. symbiont of Bathymodiolus heckerae]